MKRLKRSVECTETKTMGAKAFPTWVFGGFWSRLAAFVIDTVLLQLVLGPGSAAFAGMISTLVGRHILDPDLGHALAAGFDFAFRLTACVLYFGVLQALWSGTLGKRFMGLRLVGEDLQPLSWQKGISRYLMLLIGALPLQLGLIVAAFHPRKQAWHDRAVGSVVIYPKRLEALISSEARVDALPSAPRSEGPPSAEDSRKLAA